MFIIAPEMQKVRKRKSMKNKKSSKQQKATVDTKKLLRGRRKRFIPLLIISLIIVFMLPAMAFMVIQYISDPMNETDLSYTSVLGEITEAQPSESLHTTPDPIDTPADPEPLDEQLSLPERYPELFPELSPESSPELIPDLSSEQVQEDRPRRSRVNPVGTGVKIAYLTFDDGPSREITPGILDLLAEEGIKATFFVLPREGVDDIYLRLINEGHEIGNHSFSHNYTTLYRGNADAFKEDIIKAREFISTNFNYTMTNFRFPGGSMSWNNDVVDVRIGIIEELGYNYFDWHIDSGDAHPRQADKSAGALTSIVLNNTNNIEHVIVLMHDSGNKNTSLEALPAIIQGLREQGYSFGLLRDYPGG